MGDRLLKTFRILGVISVLALGFVSIVGSFNSGHGDTYTVGGSVSGLSGTLVLQNNGGDDLTITADGDFTFNNALKDGEAYRVTVFRHN
jgi:hypothetical protein